MSYAEESNRFKAICTILATLLILPRVVFEAFVFCRLWEWFIVPFGVMQIGKAHAYGLMILATALSLKKRDFDAPEVVNPLIVVAQYLAAWLAFWSVGALVHYLMVQP